MNDKLQRYLDGEIPLEALSEPLRVEALRWEARVEGSLEAGAAGMPAGLEARIRRAVESEASMPAWRRAWLWLVGPRTVTVSPLAAGAGALVVLAVALLPWWAAAPGTVPQGPVAVEGPASPAAAVVEVYVEFALEAPSARSVSVAGDFSAWDPAVELHDPDGDGVWSGRVRLQPGVHHYMFLLDEGEWVTDPRASRHVDDGFGNRNAVLVVPSADELRL